ncbi:Antitoxin component of toxin-antitoxin stability system, DNA-binding transcriptional repressor [bacterium JGI 053]|nr:Antitoxin component of toxin-antitoxin stability system, DNA-binding transcriptional repressor [bacterium JGI 053]
MPRSAAVSEVADNFSEFLEQVIRGETFVLTRDGIAVAELRPVRIGRQLSELPAIFASLPRLSDDEAAAFAAEIDEARGELARTPGYDPWESWSSPRAHRP